MKPFSARLAIAIASLGVLGLLLALLGAATGVLAPFAAFGLFFMSLLLGLPAILVGLFALWRSRHLESPARGRAFLAIGMGLALLAAMMVLAAPAGEWPPIHDITTSPDRPPVFQSAAHGPWPVDGEEARKLHLENYKLAPIDLSVAPDAAVERAVKAAESLGWTVVDRGALRLEAHDTSRAFRFVDDVVVEFEPTSAGTRLHVRSTSRVGQSDLGANAARIRRFEAALKS